MPGAKKAGACDPNEQMQVTIVLRERQPKSQHPSVADLVASGERISRTEYEARYGADPQDIKTVEAFAKAHGLPVKQTNPFARSVSLDGTAGAFAEAFQVELSMYEIPGGSYRGRTGALSIPSELHGVVVSVHGLDNRPQATTHFRVAAASAAASTSYTALQVAKAYNFPTSGNGQGQTIGIIELGGGFTQSDLNTYFGSLSISPAPSVTAVSVDGAKNQPTGDTSGPDTEVMLDIEVAGAIAPGAKIVVYFAPNTDAGFLDGINQAVTDKTNQPAVISISWGGAESTWTAQSLQSYNTALQAASAVGVTVCVACGDDGSTDGVTDGLDHVDFPASSPYSLACGGTSLTISGGSIASEVVWNDLPSDGATGGGVSATFPLPSWQTSANVPPSVNPGNFVGRGMPDVAGDADPSTGYEVQVDGSQFTVGGTSAVAPLWAGLLTLLNQALGKSVGYLNPGLYQSIHSASNAFRDITSGRAVDGEAPMARRSCRPCLPLRRSTLRPPQILNRNRSRLQSRSRSRPQSRSRSRPQSQSRNRSQLQSQSRNRSRPQSRSRSQNRLQSQSRNRSQLQSQSRNRSQLQSQSRNRSRPQSRSRSQNRLQSQSRNRSQLQSQSQNRSRLQSQSRNRKDSIVNKVAKRRVDERSPKALTEQLE
jgi:kumamolisin